MKQELSRNCQKKGAAPLSDEEEQTAHGICVKAQCACLID
jgi:hypothetical protein